jgi:DNA helicase HerA-like ATPase
MDGAVADGLSDAIVDTARLMRHDGIRLFVSTQSPLALAPELLELVSVAVMHRFHSRDWHVYLAKKLPLPEGSFEAVRELQPGHALVFATRAVVDRGEPLDSADAGESMLAHVRVRQRITADRGATRTNRGGAPAASPRTGAPL